MTAPTTEAALDPDALDAAIGDATRAVGRLAEKLGVRFPDDTTTGGRYLLRPAPDGLPEGSNVGWTTCFVPGTQWLSYEVTGDTTFRTYGEAHVESFVDRVGRGLDLETHDLGFLYTLSCVAPARLLADERARDAALAAAGHLMVRFLEPAGILQAWGDLDDPAQRGRTIIDSLMNTPLLFWASQAGRDPRFADAAARHVRQLRDHILREDDSTFHTFYWDPETGDALRGGTEQGQADGSCWARGQAWGILGFSLNYRYLRDRTLLDAAERCARYFLAHLPADGVPVWDLMFGVDSGEPRDSSAAAIAACGLDELAGHLEDGGEEAAARATELRAAARRILAALVEGYAPADGASDALLLHGVYDRPKGVGVDEGTLWGDYFYLEALVRAARPEWTPYW
ncbi:glycoside hydrolase family 88 protein [Luteimicrobium sp. DT211]|uniref:glycoside hydrolase family 88 protein n=1 Tax=Luteimicrobium sp. DT211 TaxID=3393412 RepID=UPI003CF25E51